jgi:hypothetical protein
VCAIIFAGTRRLSRQYPRDTKAQAKKEPFKRRAPLLVGDAANTLAAAILENVNLAGKTVLVLEVLNKLRNLVLVNAGELLVMSNAVNVLAGSPGGNDGVGGEHLFSLSLGVTIL